MKQYFAPYRYFPVPDGTEVSPFLNQTDTEYADVLWGALGDFSIAAGRIAPGVVSWIHCHPAVHQVTYVVSGTVTIHMRDPGDAAPYRLDLRSGQATISGPGTLVQLQNSGDAVAEVLYIVSPSYVCEMEGDSVLHNDSILIAKSWDEPAAKEDISKEALYEARANRAEAKRRLGMRKGVVSPSLDDDDVLSPRETYDYLAPDLSEIRLLAEGEHGGFAHCRLPRGRVSSPVRHRTVEELWYVLDGEGEIWRSRHAKERVDKIQQGDSILIRVDTSFQFRSDLEHDLNLLLATMPPWPGPREAIAVPGKWTAISSPSPDIDAFG